MSNNFKYGLIGKNISYSFSKKYFTNKFTQLGLTNHSYVNFDLKDIEDFPLLLKENRYAIAGLNVTIPYKEEILKYVDEIDMKAQEIGAVNTIKILSNNKLKGFNTDIYGFENSLKPLIKEKIDNALILGTGGASKAIAFVLKKLNISFQYVSRKSNEKNVLLYEDLGKRNMQKALLIINCTPLGTYPKVNTYPDIPYHFLTKKHILFDLVYNPKTTTFMQKGIDLGATVKNGEEMLRLQADKSWEIWNS